MALPIRIWISQSKVALLSISKVKTLNDISPFLKKALVFMCLQYKSFENIVRKGEIAHNEQFLFSPNVFYPFGELSAISIKFKIVCKFSVLESLKFVVWEKVENPW